MDTAPIPDTAPPPEAAPTLVPADLSEAIIAEIDRVLATPFTSAMSPLTLELLDYIAVTRAALRHRNAALQRIRQTLDAARGLRDRDVPVT
jgi:hypothetical protein